MSVSWKGGDKPKASTGRSATAGRRIELATRVGTLISTTHAISPAMMDIGAAKGSSSLIRPNQVVDVCGRERYATIAGVLAAVLTVARALAPRSAGAAHDLLGSYDPIFWIFVLVSIIPSGAVLLVRRPLMASHSAIVTTPP